MSALRCDKATSQAVKQDQSSDWMKDLGRDMGNFMKGKMPGLAYAGLTATAVLGVSHL
jgi:hypothetical protein